MSDGDMGNMMGGVMGLGIGLIGLKILSNVMDDDQSSKKKRKRKGRNFSIPKINI